MIDLDKLALSVALAIYEDCRPDGEGWDDLAQTDKDDFLNVAKVAMKAQAAWFREHSIKVIPPGAVPVPESREEATAYLVASQRWLQKNPPKLIKPPYMRQ